MPENEHLESPHGPSLTENNSAGRGKRLDVLDVAKGLGILLVIYAHVNYNSKALTLIYSFHMPLFFFISGMVFDRKKYGSFTEFLKRKWTTTVIPYLLFAIAPILGVFLLEHTVDSSVDFTKQQYVCYLLQAFFSEGSLRNFNVPMWFVPSLLAVEMIYFFISQLKMLPRILVSIAVTALGYFIASGWSGFNNSYLPWTFDSALFAMGFYAAGNITAPYIRKGMEALKGSRWKILICFVLLALCVKVWLPLAQENGKISLGQKLYNNGFLLYATGILGTVGILLISMILEKSRVLKYLGQNTFPLMGVHYMIRNYVVWLAYELLNIPMYSASSYKETAVPFLIILGLSILAAMLYNVLRKQMSRLLQRIRCNPQTQ